ncbi:phage integrase [Mycobacteroides abscessus]|nr:phage integrase [Mycobacteroides abscessus]
MTARPSDSFERFGSRRLSEVPTTFLGAYLADLAELHGPGSAKTCRSALSGMFRHPHQQRRSLREPGARGRARQGCRTQGPHRRCLPYNRRGRPVHPRCRTKVDSTVPADPLGRRMPEPAQELQATDGRRVLRESRHGRLRRPALRAKPAHKPSARCCVAKVRFDQPGVRALGKIIRVKGKGLVRVTKDDDPKNRFQPISLPEFAIKTLKARKRTMAKRKLAFGAPVADEFADLVFPSDEWTPRGPTNVATQWRRIRTALGIAEDITAHSFRKAGAIFKRRCGTPHPRHRRLSRPSRHQHHPGALPRTRKGAPRGCRRIGSRPGTPCELVVL